MTDNENNRVLIDLSLSEPLQAYEAALVYTRSKPSDWLNHNWDNLTDMYFNNTVEISTNIGSTTVTAAVHIIERIECFNNILAPPLKLPNDLLDGQGVRLNP